MTTPVRAPALRPRLVRDVAPGVHRLAHAAVNCTLIEDADGGVTLVDAALPRTGRVLGRALAAIGRTEGDLRALVLTHAHFDHMGVAADLVSRLGLPLYAHPAEHDLVAHPYRYAHESTRLRYPLRHPAGLPSLTRMVLAGALAVRGVPAALPLVPGESLPVPGRPMPVATPGHTAGHCALLIADRGVLLTGDALVTLDPYTGERGPRIVAGAATADSAAALGSLDAIAATGARLLLPGHGEPWRGDPAEAVRLARAAGPR